MASLEQLKALAEKIKADPKIRQQFLSTIEQPTTQPPATTGGILQRIGLGGQKVPPSIVGKAAGAAIGETTPEALFEQQERERTQKLFGSIQPAPTEQFQEVPTAPGKSGFELKPEEEARRGGLGAAATERARLIQRLATGQRISFTNLEKVTGSISDLDRVFVQGHKEGVIGAGRASKVGLAIAKERGGELLDRFDAANKFEGKKAEVLFNMIPMLTQQGEKPGSVRIMRSVLRLLGKTLPDVGTSLKAGKNQMGESIRSFFRFARASELTGLEFDKEFGEQNFDSIGDNDLNKWIDKVKRASERVQLGDEESEALEDLIDNSLFSSGDLLSQRRAGGESQIRQTELEDVEKQLEELNRLGGL